MTIVIDNSRGKLWAEDLMSLLDRFPNTAFPVDVVDEVIDYGDQIHLLLKGFVMEETALDLAEEIEDLFGVRVNYIL
jgi:hypothetical protein